MTTEGSNMEENDLFSHLYELRKRLLYSVVGILIFAIVSYLYSEVIVSFLSKPYFDAFKDHDLIGTGPAEAFILKIKIALFSGIIISIPWIFIQIWLFIEPGLKQNEKRLFIPFVFFASLLFLIGVTFSYFKVMPFAFSFFFEQYKSISITPQIKLGEHLSIMLKGLFGFGIIFEMPILAFFLAKLGVINSKFLIDYARHSIVIIFLIAAFLTPPDVVTQFLMAGPLLFLYFISYLVVKLSEKKS